MDLCAEGHLVRSAAYLDPAIASCEGGLPREKYLYFNRACIAALTGDKKRALKFLTAVVDKGLWDVEALETTEAIDAIRDTDRFREIMARARSPI